jgi:hypothetical protein
MAEDADEAQEDAFVKKMRRSARILDSGRSSRRKQQQHRDKRRTDGGI